jgi:FkbM family methyltransferase
MPMISYAQNREDVVLARAFGDQVRGFYIDVGAEHPAYSSVTKHFYDEGWRGINIEPSPSSFALLESARPEDINLDVGLADAEGKASFFEGPPENHGASTFRADVATRYRHLGQEFHEIPDVPLTTLALICEEYVGGAVIDFLKVDVEGFEAAVIAGGDWERWRPRVIVVEATEPNERTPSHDTWEPALLSAGYVFALFDGLNRFYAHRDEPEILCALAYPACIFDDYVEAARVEERDALATERDALATERDALATERDALATERDQALRQLSDRSDDVALWQSQARHSERAARLSEDRVHYAEDEALRAELGAAALRDRLAGESTARLASEQLAAAESAARLGAEQLAAAESAASLSAEHLAATERAAREAVTQELVALRATKTFRLVAPLRAVYGFFRRKSNSP